MPNLHSVSGRLSPATRGALFYLALFCAAGVYAPFINVYFSDLGLNGRQIGLLGALPPLMTLIFATPFSALVDRRRGRVRALRAALAGIALLFIWIGLPRSFGALVPLMALLALLFAPVMPIADGLIARMAVRYRLNYGGIRLWGSIGYATSSVSFGVLWQQLGFGPMFALASIMFVPVIWVAGRLEEGPVIEQANQSPSSALLHDRGLLAILGATFLAGLATGVALVFEGIYMEYLGGGPVLIGMLPAISAFSELPTMWYSLRIAHRLQGARTLLLSYALFGGAFLGYAVARAPWMLLTLAICKGLGFGLYFTSTVRLITERTPEDRSATAQALMSSAMFGLAPLVAGPLGGIVRDAVGPSAVFLLGGLAVGLAALVIALASRKGVLDTIDTL